MPELSVVMPAFNEVGRIGANVRTIPESLKDLDLEVIVSDDGSTDATAAEVEAVGVSGVKLVRNPHKGRGAALKAGMAAATGEIIVTVDADLSYGPEEVRKLYDHMKAHPECDLVIGSCWMPGGSVEGVPPFRAWVSRMGNRLLRFAFEGRFHTTTGVFRGYRAGKLKRFLLDPGLVSEGKEVYLECLHKALQAGWKVDEIPARLAWKRGPKGGVYRFVPTVWSHLSFLFARRQAACELLAFGLMLTVVLFILGTNLLEARFPMSLSWHRWMDLFRRFGMVYWLAGVVLFVAVIWGAKRWRAVLWTSTPPPSS